MVHGWGLTEQHPYRIRHRGFRDLCQFLHGMGRQEPLQKSTFSKKHKKSASKGSKTASFGGRFPLLTVNSCAICYCNFILQQSRILYPTLKNSRQKRFAYSRLPLRRHFAPGLQRHFALCAANIFAPLCRQYFCGPAGQRVNTNSKRRGKTGLPKGWAGRCCPPGSCWARRRRGCSFDTGRSGR